MKTTIAIVIMFALSGCGSEFAATQNNIPIEQDSGSDGVFSDQLMTTDVQSDIQNQDALPNIDAYDSQNDDAIEENNKDINSPDIETTDTTTPCVVNTCPNTEHGTPFCNANNQCDIQCLNGCNKNGQICDCPKPECCPDPNHNMDNPQCDGKQSGRCVNGTCQFDGYKADTDSCIAYCTTCMNKEFDHIYVDIAGPPPISYCECKP